MAQKESRIYFVTDKLVGDSGRLVRARHPAGVLRHLNDELVVRVATQDDLVNAIKLGTQVEDATAAPDADQADVGIPEAAC